LVKIKEFKGTNEKAPLDFIHSRIKELIKKKKKVDFIKKFDKEILENAKQENKFEIFN
jgi:DNA-dependent RNA polymerase auxiliary subunit epsilon